MRKLATIRKIDKLEPIEGADKILKATIGGWELVTAKDNGFKEGDYVIYLEVDSWVPHEVAPFLSKGAEPREFNGVKGERLKTIRLRGQLSQGLILPLEASFIIQKIGAGPGAKFEDYEGFDVTELLGIQKYEKPLPAALSGKARGNFPGFISKTDQERCQNLKYELKEWVHQKLQWEVTEKIEGSSITIYRFNELQGVCSRNLDLALDQTGNAFVDTARQTKALSALVKVCEQTERNLALQGELFGGNIQSGYYGKGTPLQIAIYDIYDIDKQRYVTAADRYQLVKEVQREGALISHVPVIHKDAPTVSNIDELLKLADGQSVINSSVPREGLVYKSLDGRYSFKAISNSYLLKTD